MSWLDEFRGIILIVERMTKDLHKPKVMHFNAFCLKHVYVSVCWDQIMSDNRCSAVCDTTVHEECPACPVSTDPYQPTKSISVTSSGRLESLEHVTSTSFDLLCCVKSSR